MNTEEQFRFWKVLDSSLNEIYIFDPETLRFIYANQGALANTGYSLEEIKHFTPLNIKPQFNEETFMSYIQALLTKKKEKVVFHTVHKRKDNSLYPVEVHLQLVDSDKTKVFVAIILDITERLKSENALKESEEKFSRIFDLSPDAILLTSLNDSKIINTNESFLKIYGYNKSEAIGQTIIGLNLWNDEDVRKKFLEGLKKFNRIKNFEATFRTKNGSLETVLISSDIIEIHNKKYALNIIRNITELKKASEALMESQKQVAFFADLLEYSSQPFAIGYTDGKLGRYNSAFLQLTGYNGDELSALDWNIDLTPPEWIEMELTKLQELHRTGKPVRYEKEYIRKDGTRIPVELFVHMKTDDKGKPEYYYAFVTDISYRNQAKEKLRESEYWLKESQRVSHIGSYVLDINTGLWTSTDELNKIFGIDPDITRNFEVWTNILHPDHREKMIQYFQNDVLAKKGMFNREYLIRRMNDQQVRWVHGKGELSFDENGKPAKMVGTIQDITERKLSEEKIRKLNAELEQRVAERTSQLDAKIHELETFSYSVSHDLKAPLRGIDGYSHILLEDYKDKLDEEGQKILENIRSGTLQMNQLINDLLSYSRLERKALSPGKIGIRNLVDSIFNNTVPVNDLQKIEFKHNIPEIEIIADPEGLTMSLRNLIENAYKFTAKMEHPVIEVGYTEQSSSDIIWVRDNGIGFDMKYHQRIFEIFQRLHRSEDYPGTGIGLAMVQKAMERMGGKVWAESTPGKETTFYLSIPKQ